jgi:hypothetical protein
MKSFSLALFLLVRTKKYGMFSYWLFYLSMHSKYSLWRGTRPVGFLLVRLNQNYYEEPYHVFSYWSTLEMFSDWLFCLSRPMRRGSPAWQSVFYWSTQTCPVFLLVTRFRSAQQLLQNNIKRNSWPARRLSIGPHKPYVFSDWVFCSARPSSCCRTTWRGTRRQLAAFLLVHTNQTCFLIGCSV